MSITNRTCLGAAAVAALALLSNAQKPVYPTEHAARTVCGGTQDYKLEAAVTTGPSDVNGDGVGDLIVGHQLHNHYTTGVGPYELGIFFGKPGFLEQGPATIANADVLIQGPSGGPFGSETWWVDSGIGTGDVNGDGIDDIAIGFASEPMGYNLIVVYGRFNWPSTVQLGANASNADIRVDIPSGQLRHVATGDVDGDGYAEVSIAGGGTPSADAYVLLGGNHPSGSVFSHTNPGDPITKLQAKGTSTNGIGFVAFGDVNGDGLDEVLCRDNQFAPSEIAVVQGTGFGNGAVVAPFANPLLLIISPATPNNEFTGVATADFDGDGIQDIIPSSYTADYNGVSRVGRAWLLLGRTSWSSPGNVWNLGTTPANHSWVGHQSGGGMPVTVAVGDVDRDGDDDLLLSAYTLTPAESYLVLGGFPLSGATTTISPSTADVTFFGSPSFFTLNGAAMRDLDADGVPDVVLYSVHANSPGGPPEEGCAYLFHGATLRCTRSWGNAYLTVLGSHEPGSASTIRVSGDPYQSVFLLADLTTGWTPLLNGVLYLGLSPSFGIVTNGLPLFGTNGQGDWTLNVPIPPWASGPTIQLQALLVGPSLAMSNLSSITPGGSEVLFLDDFSTHACGQFPGGDWRAFAAPAVVNCTARGSDPGLELQGTPGGCWAAGAYHPLPACQDFRIEFEAMAPDTGSGGCHANKLTLELTSGPSSAFPRRDLLYFAKNGQIMAPGTGVSLRAWTPGTYYRVRVHYARVSATEVRIAYWIDGASCATVIDTAQPFEDSNFWFGFEGPDGLAYVDSVAVVR